MIRAEIDYRNHSKVCNLTLVEKRLLKALALPLALEPTADLKAKDYLARHALGGNEINGALQKLTELGVIKFEDMWRIHPPARSRWYKAMVTQGGEVSEKLRWGPAE